MLASAAAFVLSPERGPAASAAVTLHHAAFTLIGLSIIAARRERRELQHTPTHTLDSARRPVSERHGDRV